MPTPILFLDVDGVVNADPKPNSKNYHEYVPHDVPVNMGGGLMQVFKIWVRPKVIDFLNHIHRSGSADVRWLTTWGKHAVTALSPAIGLDRFTVAAEPPDPSHPTFKSWNPTWWKLTVIKEQVGDRPFLFLDDYLSKGSRTILRDLDNPSLLLTPFATPGLEDWHLDRIAAFLDQHKQPA